MSPCCAGKDWIVHTNAISQPLGDCPWDGTLRSAATRVPTKLLLQIPGGGHSLDILFASVALVRHVDCPLLPGLLQLIVGLVQSGDMLDRCHQLPPTANKAGANFSTLSQTTGLHPLDYIGCCACLLDFLYFTFVMGKCSALGYPFCIARVLVQPGIIDILCHA